MLVTEPELFPFTTRLSSGLDPINDPMQSSVTELASLYFRGSTVYSMGPLAFSAADASLSMHSLSTLGLARADNVSSVDAKIKAIAHRANTRRLELSEGWKITANRPEVIRARQQLAPVYNQVR